MTSTRDPERPQPHLDAASSVFAEKGFAGLASTTSPPAPGSTRRCSTTTSATRRRSTARCCCATSSGCGVALDEALATGGSARARLEAVITALTRMVQRHPDHHG